MYQSRINSMSPEEAEYQTHGGYDTYGTARGMDPMSGVHMQVYDTQGFRSYAYSEDRDYPSRSLSMPTTLPAQDGVHYALLHQAYMPPSIPSTYSSMPTLIANDSHIHQSAQEPDFGTFERSTAASEYGYSGAYSTPSDGVPRNALARHGSYSPGTETEAFLPTHALGTQEASMYLQVTSGSPHRHRNSHPSTKVQHESPRARRGRSSSRPISPPELETLSSEPEGEGHTRRKQKTRKAFEPERRLEVRRMRETGACFRCRWLKKPCGDGIPCPQCVNVRGRVWTYPCMRVNMTDLAGLSDIGLQTHQRNYLTSNILDWTGAEATIEVTHGFFGVLSLVAEQIVPADVQALVTKWPPENKRPNDAVWRWFEDSALNNGCYEVTTMPYAIRRFQISEPELDLYLDCDRDRRVSDITLGLHADSLDGMGFTKAMMQAAWDFAELTGITMIKKALRIKTAVYLQNYFLQCEVSPTGDARGRVVAPAFVQLQLDLLIDGRRAELEKEVLAELQRTVFSRQRKSWFAIFLTIYILLNALEETLWSHYAWKRKGLVSSDFSYERAQEIADVLVAVYRAINQSSQPFIRPTDNEEIDNVLIKEYGATAGAIFRSLSTLINTHGPLLAQRKDAVFDFHDPFSLEGKFSGLLLLS